MFLLISALAFISFVVFAIIFFHFIPAGLLTDAVKRGFPVSFIQMAEIIVRGYRPETLFNAWILCSQTTQSSDKFFMEKGNRIPLAEDLVAHQLCGGDIIKAARCLVKARRNGIDITYKDLSILELTGKDIETLIQENRNKKKRDDFMKSALSMA